MANQNPEAADTSVLSRFAPEQIVVQPIDPELAAEQAAVAARRSETAAGEPAAPAGASPTANPSHQPGASAAAPEAKLPAQPDKAAATPDKAAVTPGKSAVTPGNDGKNEVAATDKKPPARTVAEIEAEMDATRERLATTVGQLQEALQPKNLLRLQVEKVKGYYVDEYGAVRPERVAGTVGVVVVSVVVIKVVKRVF